MCFKKFREIKITFLKVNFWGIKKMPYEPRYFKPEEVQGLNDELVAGIDRARHKAGIPFIITSSKRVLAENDRLVHLGAVPDSAHLTGHAVDLRCTNSTECWKIVESLIVEGFKRIIIGIKKDAVPGSDEFYHNVHVDNSPDKPSPVLSIKLYP